MDSLLPAYSIDAIYCRYELGGLGHAGGADEIGRATEDIQAKFQRLVALIESRGLEHLREPYVKHLDGKLWELRMSGRDGIARAIYVTVAGRRLVILHVFVKKTEKTPARELEIARQRAKEVQ